jgi:hypothetical protein
VVCAGTREELKKLHEELNKDIVFKCKGILGPDKSRGDIQEAVILNRLVRYVETDGRPAIEIEPDPRHADIVIKSLGLAKGNSKPVSAPGVKQKAGGEQTALTGVKVKEYRSLAMRVNFLAEDRDDLKFPAKELARHMKEPTVAAWEKLKHLGRYLLGCPRVVLVYRWQTQQRKLMQYVDSDYAGCVVTRKSTNAGVLMHGCHKLRGYSSTQAVPALSSGESEFYAGVKGVASGLGSQTYAKDLGVELQLEVLSDSSAARAMMLRQGLGKAKHISTQFLWVQQMFADKRATLKKVDTKKNLSDVNTKYLDGKQLWELMHKIGYEKRDGRSKSALKAQM